MSKPAKPKPEDVLTGLQPLWRGSKEALLRCWDAVLNEMLILHYPPFRASDDEDMLAQAITGIRPYVEALAGYPEDVLRKAWRQTLEWHKTERWPVLGVILENCRGGQDSARASTPGRYRMATSEEQEYQRVAYGGEIRMPMVRDCDVAHHRRDAERKRAGEKGGYNPFSGGKRQTA